MSQGTGKKYPVSVMGMTFKTGDDLHDWIDALHARSHLTRDERLAVERVYDNGFLAHWDFKQLTKKRVAP